MPFVLLHYFIYIILEDLKARELLWLSEAQNAKYFNLDILVLLFSFSSSSSFFFSPYLNAYLPFLIKRMAKIKELREQVLSFIVAFTFFSQIFLKKKIFFCCLCSDKCFPYSLIRLERLSIKRDEN